LALAVVFLSLLTWMINDARDQTRRVHEEIRRVREEIDRSRPTLTLEGEVAPPAHIDKGDSIGITFNYQPRFASPPHLTFPDGHSGWKITLQTADFFSLNSDMSDAGNSRKFRWKAEGHPAKTNVEVQNEAIGRTLGDILNELRLQGGARRTENAAIQREVQLLREMEKKRFDEGKM
jgi:hypothetical protein